MCHECVIKFPSGSASFYMSEWYSNLEDMKLISSKYFTDKVNLLDNHCGMWSDNFFPIFTYFIANCQEEKLHQKTSF